MAESSVSPSSLELRAELPYGRYEYQWLTTPATPHQPFQVVHGLRPDDPSLLQWQVVQAQLTEQPAASWLPYELVGSAHVRARDFITLRCPVASARLRLLLTIPHTRAEQR